MNDTLPWLASILTVVAALMVALSISRKWTGWGFVVFSVSSCLWIAIGILDRAQPLTWQNLSLLAINLVGVYRWLIRPETPASKSRTR